MNCADCGYPFRPGEYVKQLHVYWREEHLGGKVYRDGVKPAGWAHEYCG